MTAFLFGAGIVLLLKASVVLACLVGASGLQRSRGTWLPPICWTFGAGLLLILPLVSAPVSNRSPALAGAPESTAGNRVAPQREISVLPRIPLPETPPDRLIQFALALWVAGCLVLGGSLGA